MKTFPIAWPPEWSATGLDRPDPIPWEAIEPYERQALKNHGRTLSDLAATGGLDAEHVVDVLERRAWRSLGAATAIAKLARHVDAWKKGRT